MPILGTPGRQSIQALFMMLLAFLSQALELLEPCMDPYDGDEICKVENWVKDDKNFTYYTYCV